MAERLRRYVEAWQTEQFEQSRSSLEQGFESLFLHTRDESHTNGIDNTISATCRNSKPYSVVDRTCAF